MYEYRYTKEDTHKNKGGQKMARKKRTSMKKIISGIITLIIIGIAGILGTNEEFINTVSNIGEQTNSQNVQQV